MKNWDIFYNFLNNLKRPNNIALIEAIEQGVETLFESATVTQTLKNRAANNPFFAIETKFLKQMIRNIMETYEYNFPETGDKRIPFEHLLSNKFADVFINWVAWQVVSDTEIETEKVLEEIEEIKNNLADPNQRDLFGYNGSERQEAFIGRTKEISHNFLKQHEDDYNDEILKLLYEKPQEDIYNPAEDGRHNGDMAGWEDEEYEAFNDLRYSGDHRFEEEPVQAWAAYVFDATSDPNIAKRFKDPNYHDTMAYNDADSMNETNYEKTIEQVNVEIGREKYEEAEEVIQMDNDFVWVNSGKASCSAEGKQMGHCGNEYGDDKEKGDELWSLRQGTSPQEWESHITVIINGDIIDAKRVIKQIKGNGPKSGNNKPSDEYHPYILKLLTSKDNDKWIVDGFYTENYHAPNANFQISDLNEESKKLLHNVRPELFKHVREMENA